MLDVSEPAGPRQRVLWLSTISFTLLFAVWLMFGMLMLKIAPELGLDDDQKAWAVAVAILAGSLLRLHFGIWSDRYGGKAMMTGLLFFTAIPCYFTSRVETYEQLLICAALFGVAGNSFAVGISWNSAWFTDKSKGTALGVFGAGNVGASLTKFLAPSILPLLPAAGLLGGAIPGGWRFIPVLYAVLLLGMAAIVWFAAPAADKKPGKGRPMREMLAPLQYMRVWRFSLYYVVVFGAYLALAGGLAMYYKKTYGVSDNVAGYLAALYIFPASLLRPLGGWLSDKFGPRAVTYAAFLAIALPLSAICLPSNVLDLGIVPFTILMVTVGAGMGVGKASVYKYIPNYFPKDVGAVGGIVGLLGALGGFLLPLLFVRLARWTGSPQAGFLAILLLTLASLAWLHLVVMRMKSAERVATMTAAPVPAPAS